MQTVISAVEARQTVHAVNRLVASGFSREAIHIQGAGDLFGSGDSVEESAAAQPPEQEARGLLSSIGHFVTSLFSLDTPASVAYTYTEALQRGGSVLLVDVDDPAKGERVIAILSGLGATAVRVIERDPDQPLRAASEQAFRA